MLALQALFEHAHGSCQGAGLVPPISSSKLSPVLVAWGLEEHSLGELEPTSVPALPGRAGTHKWNPGAAFASGLTWLVSPRPNWELLFPDLNYG